MSDERAAAGPAHAIEEWLAELGVAPLERAQREGIHSWDLQLDGRVRNRVRLTLILDPAIAMVAWVHYAPPLTDHVRRTYRQLLRWNDELPLVKFALGDEEQPVLSAELAAELLSRDRLGLLLARLLAVCDLLYPESAAWVDRIGGPDQAVGPAGVRLLERYADQLGELAQAPPLESADGR